MASGTGTQQVNPDRPLAVIPGPRAPTAARRAAATGGEASAQPREGGGGTRVRRPRIRVDVTLYQVLLARYVIDQVAQRLALGRRGEWEYGRSMSIRWYSVVVDCRDVAALSHWWAAALDWRIIYEAADEVIVVPPIAMDPDRSIPPLERGPGLVFVPVPEGKTAKNRLHIDLAPSPDADQEAEVRRLETLGARRVDVGQDPEKVSWVVLADPEGNEFCVLSARE
jgi:hypothetical protein